MFTASGRNPRGELDRQLARIAAREKPTILRHASRAFPALDAGTIEDCWQQACIHALESCTSVSERSVRGFLARALQFRCLDHCRRVRRLQPLDDAEDASSVPVDPRPEPDVLAERRERSAIISELVWRLPPSTGRTVALRYRHGLSPEQVQRVQGLTRRQYARRIERGMRAIREHAAALEAGGICDELRPALAALAAYRADAVQTAAARRHVVHCAGCRAELVALRSRDGAAAAADPLLVGRA